MSETQKSKDRHRGCNASVSKTVKKVMSKLQIIHLDYFSKVHKHDVANNREYLGDVLGAADVAKLTDQQVHDVMKICGFKLIDQSTFVPFSDIIETSELAINMCFEDGSWTEKEGDEWVKFVTDIQTKQKVYYERGHGGNSKKRELGVNDKYSEPLNVIFARSPPWLATVLSEATDEKMVKAAIARVAAHFEKATGYSVKTVNVHREIGHDLHIHILYSDVKECRLPVGDKERKRRVAALKKKLTEELREDKKNDPTVKIDKTSVLREYNARGLDSQISEYSDKLQNRKVLRRGAVDDGVWPIEKRSIATMGTAYRYKAWIWDSAKNPDDKEKIRAFRDNSLINGNFTNRVAKVPDLEERYLDWWLEQTMFREIYSGLSADRQKLVSVGKADAVSNYLEYGRNNPHPMQKAALKYKVEIDKKKDTDRIALADWRDKAQSELDKYESKLFAFEDDLIDGSLDLKADREIFTDELDRSESKLFELEDDLIAKSKELKIDRQMLAEDLEMLSLKKATIEKIEVASNLVLGRESTVAGREITVRDNLMDITHREKNLADDSAKFSKDAEKVREEGRREILNAIAAEILPTTAHDEKASKDDVIDTVRENLGKARMLDEIKPVVEGFIKKITMVTNSLTSKKLPKTWIFLSGYLTKFKSILGVKDSDSKQRESKIDNDRGK